MIPSRYCAPIAYKNETRCLKRQEGLLSKLYFGTFAEKLYNMKFSWINWLNLISKL